LVNTDIIPTYHYIFLLTCLPKHTAHDIQPMTTNKYLNIQYSSLTHAVYYSHDSGQWTTDINHATLTHA